MNILLLGMDIGIVDGGLPMVTGIDEVRQAITSALLSFEGDWFLDLDLGMPYFQTILQKSTTLSEIETIFLDTISQVPGVLDIETFTLDLDPATRVLDIATRVRTSDGVLDYNLNESRGGANG